jgi:peptidoglycan/LPS O-acetylase OafA/YrhL
VSVTAAPGAQQEVSLAPEFPLLDSLRAVGALAVLTTHVAFQAGDYTGRGVWGSLLGRLDVGVAIFFVLSGFLLSRPYLARAVADRPAPSTGRYLWKRFVRIYPVYAVTVVAALALIPENADGRGPGAWVRTLLLLDVYTRPTLPHGLTQMWSLAAEVAFYVALPLIMLAAVGRRRRLTPRRVLAVIGGLAAVSVAWHASLTDQLQRDVPGLPANWLPAHLTWFAVGIALALTHVLADPAVCGDRPPRPVRALRLLGSLPGTCWSLVAALLLVAATPLAGPTLLFLPTTAQSLTKHLLYTAVGGLIVLTGVFPADRSRYARILATPFLRHLGHISYSTFCIHLIVLAFVWDVTGFQQFHGHGLPVWLLTAALSLLASDLLYRGVERPAMRLRNLGRRRPSTASQPSSPPTAARTR